jgi:hypothetical protein
MIFEVENVLLHALWAKRNAGRGTPAKYHPWGVAVARLPIPVLYHPLPSLFLRDGTFVLPQNRK